MHPFHAAWTLCRGRFVKELEGLSHAQLNFRLHSDSLSIAEMAVHVAGVEVSFATQLTGQAPEGELVRLKAAATDGSVNDKPFPYSVEEMTPERVGELMEVGRAHMEPLLAAPTPELLAKELVSALGPVITGEGALARMAFHAAYHQGQAYLIRTAPGFPA